MTGPVRLRLCLCKMHNRSDNQRRLGAHHRGLASLFSLCAHTPHRSQSTMRGLLRVRHLASATSQVLACRSIAVVHSSQATTLRLASSAWATWAVTWLAICSRQATLLWPTTRFPLLSPRWREQSQPRTPRCCPAASCGPEADFPLGIGRGCSVRRRHHNAAFYSTCAGSVRPKLFDPCVPRLTARLQLPGCQRCGGGSAQWSTVHRLLDH
jgi:hypothetical protein